MATATTTAKMGTMTMVVAIPMVMFLPPKTDSNQPRHRHPQATLSAVASPPPPLPPVTVRRVVKSTATLATRFPLMAGSKRRQQ